ncbi:hypothetical protein SAMN05519103_00354 [Rhizobiales bacterium GAS113]|nr:hypothetical protein SAMN05519103_00354 [Rhizobiales bacterium GAS113]
MRLLIALTIGWFLGVASYLVYLRGPIPHAYLELLPGATLEGSFVFRRADGLPAVIGTGVHIAIPEHGKPFKLQ